MGNKAVPSVPLLPIDARYRQSGLTRSRIGCISRKVGTGALAPGASGATSHDNRWSKDRPETEASGNRHAKAIVIKEAKAWGRV